MLRRRRLPFGLTAVLITAQVGLLGQATAPPATAPGTAAPAPAADVLDVEQTRHFLRTARVVRTRDTLKGVTRPRRMTLSDGRIEHDAVFQTVNEHKHVQRFEGGRIELDFRDSYHFNIAAFELAALLGLAAVVPVTVERRLDGQLGSLSWWVNWKWDEQMRVKQKLRPPDTLRWRQQWDVAHVFAELIDDTDRNQTNILIGEQWQIWLVDFSRAFRRSEEPRKPERLRYCSRDLLTRLRALDEATIARAVGDHLSPAEREAVLQRRDAIVRHFDRLIAEQGEDLVLF